MGRLPDHFRDEMDDAIRRAFTTDWTTGAPDYAPIGAARVLSDPARMRSLARIQEAALEVAARWMEAEPRDA